MTSKTDPELVLQNGWLTGVCRLDSPNYGARPLGMAVDLLVVHSISLPPGQFGNGNVQALFMNRLDWTRDPYFETIRGTEVSSHFYIERTGRIWQFVSTDERAWHAGRSSFQGRANCNDFSVGVELEGLEGGGFEAIQYTQLAELCVALRRRYPIGHVVGHEHIAPGRKRDPGEGFDWNVLCQTVGWSPQCFPALAQ
jgi:N-acetyl-anhydromuramoyl-L-alanine amidase